MKKEELLEWAEKTIEGWKKAETSSHTKALANPSLIKAIKEDIKHLEEIVALIKKEVTEEWIEEKGKELHLHVLDGQFHNEAKRKDFIRSLVEEIRK